MPQLYFETYVSQYIWLVIILLTLYYLVATKYIPLLSETYKARRKLETIKTTITTSSLTDKSKTLIKDIASIKYPSSLTINSYSPSFYKSFTSWSSSI